MPHMTTSTLQAILSAERADALASTSQSALTDDRSRAMDYYLNNMDNDMPALAGRSKAVSSDVADTIHGLMPSLMEIFFGSDDVVEFVPVGPEDEEAAEQETDYVNHVFTQKNEGFKILYSFIFDALLQKVGVVKVWWEEKEEEERETYYDLDDDAFMMLVSDPAVEVIEHTMRGPDGEVISESDVAAPADDEIDPLEVDALEAEYA